MEMVCAKGRWQKMVSVLCCRGGIHVKTSILAEEYYDTEIFYLWYFIILFIGTVLLLIQNPKE